MADILGTSFNDFLVGTSSSDTINGFGGNDILDGFGGFDTLTGGFGADTFQIFASDYNANGFGYATITDFFWQEGDVVEIYSGGTAITSSFDPFFNETLIYSNNNLIGVVQGSNFDFALDAVVSF